MSITKASDKLKVVDESLSVTKFDNGYMVEISGRAHDDEWATAKLIVSSLEEVFELLEDADSLPRS